MHTGVYLYQIAKGIALEPELVSPTHNFRDEAPESKWKKISYDNISFKE